MSGQEKEIEQVEGQALHLSDLRDKLSGGGG